MNQRTAYDPFGLLANPWFFVNIGLQFMRSWQDAWMSRMRLDRVPTGGSVLALRLEAAPFARPSLEMQIAERQGRAQPWLGCLTGVQVVGGPESVAPEVIAAKAERVAEPAAKQPVAKAAVAKKPVAAKAKAAEKVAEPVVVVGTAPAAVAEPEPVAEPAASSVTSMLAMQARSLSKAVGKSPKADAAKSAVKAEAKKPAAKKAASKKA